MPATTSVIASPSGPYCSNGVARRHGSSGASCGGGGRPVRLRGPASPAAEKIVLRAPLRLQVKRVWVAAAASALIFLLAGGGLFLTFRQPKVTSATTRTWATATPSPSSSTSASPSPSSSTDQIHGVQATLPSCSAGALYSVSPIEPDKLSYILPLGNFTPLPSDHLYFVITRGAANGTNAPTETLKLFAPGDITVLMIGRQVQTTNGKIVNTD